MRKLELDASQEEIDALFQTLDADGSGTVTKDEFKAWFDAAFASVARENQGLVSSLNDRVPFEELMSAADLFKLVDKDRSGSIDKSELVLLLRQLNLDASAEEIDALFISLDTDGELHVEVLMNGPVAPSIPQTLLLFAGSGLVSVEEFEVWFNSAFGDVQVDFGAATPNPTPLLAAGAASEAVQSVLLGRRTVHNFATGPAVPDAVFRRAMSAAIAAPNHGLTEPWRFRRLGPKAVSAVGPAHVT